MIETADLKCENCKHFRGWGDWGLCCDVKYDLCYEETPACELFVLKEKVDENA